MLYNIHVHVSINVRQIVGINWTHLGTSTFLGCVSKTVIATRGILAIANHRTPTQWLYNRIEDNRNQRNFFACWERMWRTTKLGNRCLLGSSGSCIKHPSKRSMQLGARIKHMFLLKTDKFASKTMELQTTRLLERDTYMHIYIYNIYSIFIYILQCS